MFREWEKVLLSIWSGLCSVIEALSLLSSFTWKTLAFQLRATYHLLCKRKKNYPVFTIEYNMFSVNDYVSQKTKCICKWSLCNAHISENHSRGLVWVSDVLYYKPHAQPLRHSMRIKFHRQEWNLWNIKALSP